MAALGDKQSLNWQVIRLKEASSTNTLILQSSTWLDRLGLVIRADHQTAGRGARGHQWASAAGTQLQFSLVVRPHGHPGLYALVAGLAVEQAISQHLKGHLQHAPRLKWPNDVQLGGGKCCGVLIESAKTQGGTLHLVVGIGVNCLGPKTNFPRELQPILTTLQEESGVVVDLDAFMHSILEYFAAWQQCLVQEQAQKVIHAWHKRSTLPQAVQVEHVQRCFNGVAVGLNEEGYLLVNPEDGSPCVVIQSSSQVSWL